MCEREVWVYLDRLLITFDSLYDDILTRWGFRSHRPEPSQQVIPIGASSISIIVGINAGAQGYIHFTSHLLHYRFLQFDELVEGLRGITPIPDPASDLRVVQLGV